MDSFLGHSFPIPAQRHLQQHMLFLLHAKSASNGCHYQQRSPLRLLSHDHAPSVHLCWYRADNTGLLLPTPAAVPAISSSHAFLLLACIMLFFPCSTQAYTAHTFNFIMVLAITSWLVFPFVCSSWNWSPLSLTCSPPNAQHPHTFSSSAHANRPSNHQSPLQPFKPSSSYHTHTYAFSQQPKMQSHHRIPLPCLQSHQACLGFYHADSKPQSLCFKDITLHFLVLQQLPLRHTFKRTHTSSSWWSLLPLSAASQAQVNIPASSRWSFFSLYVF